VGIRCGITNVRKSKHTRKYSFTITHKWEIKVSNTQPSFQLKGKEKLKTA
jgi:hypothetical protein